MSLVNNFCITYLLLDLGARTHTISFSGISRWSHSHSVTWAGLGLPAILSLLSAGMSGAAVYTFLTPLSHSYSAWVSVSRWIFTDSVEKFKPWGSVIITEVLVSQAPRSLHLTDLSWSLSWIYIARFYFDLKAATERLCAHTVWTVWSLVSTQPGAKFVSFHFLAVVGLEQQGFLRFHFVFSCKPEAAVYDVFVMASKSR